MFGLFKKAKLTREKFEKLLGDHAEDFNEKDLSGLDLSGLKIHHKSFEKANLQGTNFSGATIESSSFEYASLEGASFANATVLTCSFEHANMSNVSLNGATIKNTRFEEANTEGVSFEGTRFSGNRYDDTTLQGAVNDTGASEAILEDWARLQASLAALERSGFDLCGVSPNDLIGFHQRSFAIENAQMQGMDYEQAVVQNGFPSVAHWDRVREYIHGKYSYLGKNSEGKQDIVIKEEFMNAMMQARMGQMQAAQGAAAAADPNLLAPAEGVSIEQWGQAAAALASLGATGTDAQAQAILAKLGLDRAKWDRGNAAWTAKMQGDTTGAIATKFGAAFQGQHAAQTGQVAGAEPCTFERFVEVMAAQSAWASQGLDIQTQLKATFGITISDYSGYGAYWSPKMSTDMSFHSRYTQLHATYEAKYAGAGFDDDLGV